MENPKRASGEILISTGRPPKFFSAILCFVALVYKPFFFGGAKVQVTGHRSGHRLQVTGHRSGYRPQVRSQVRLQVTGHRPQVRSQVTQKQ